MKTFAYLLFVSAFSILNASVASFASDDLPSFDPLKISTETGFTNVYGKLDRSSIASNSGILQIVGVLYSPNGGICTASLIGEDLILTAAHCVLSGGQLMAGRFSFQLGKQYHQVLAESSVKHVWWGTGAPDRFPEHDYAIARLTSPLGKTFGYFGVIGSTSPVGLEIFLAGYGYLSGSHALTVTTNRCNIRGTAERSLLMHDCDSSRGDSGAPVYGCYETSGCMIHALHIAEYRYGKDRSLVVENWTPETSNLAVPSSAFTSLVRQLRAQ